MSDMPSTSFETGVRIKPPFELNEVPSLIEKYFGLAVEDVKEMNSYDDKNFVVCTNSEPENKAQRFTFKITNSLDSKVEGLLGKLIVSTCALVVNISFLCWFRVDEQPYALCS